jgi:hypothetical protein
MARAEPVSSIGTLTEVEEDELLENSADTAPPLAAAPRHLRRRRLHGEIPDALLVPEVQPFVIPSAAVSEASPPSAAKSRSAEGITAHRRKRRIAVSFVVLVSISIPCLVLLLLLSP